MQRNWRCANGHSWTGELGALTFCPECRSADVYEVRLANAKPAAPALSVPAPRSSPAFVITVDPPPAAQAAPPHVLIPASSDQTLIQHVAPSSISTAEFDLPPKPPDASTLVLEPPSDRADTGVFAAPDSNQTLIDGGGPIAKPPPADTFVMEDGLSGDGPSTGIWTPDDRKDSSEGTLQIEFNDPGVGNTVDLPRIASQSTGSWNEPDNAQTTAVTHVDPALPATAVVSPASAIQLGQRFAAENAETVERPPRPAPPSPRPSDGKAPEVEGYEILGVLGRGGMGVVYKAKQKGLNRIVALKMILGGAHAGAGERGRFRAEALAVAKLQHPNIVQVYEVGERDGMPFFSLEYLDGGSLQQRMDGKPLPSRTAAAVVEQLARAMQYAHSNGIVHRDLKPANILLRVLDDAETQSDGRTDHGSSSTTRIPRLPYIPKITDFGLAKDLQHESGLTGTGAILGTPSFMSPEQAEGKTQEIGPPTDIHALGAILYDSLTGRPPFLGADPMATILQVRMMDPVPPTRWQPTLPRDIETICLKCLEKSPARRYASAGDLADDLRRFLDDEPIQARPSSAIEKALKWARRRPMAAAFVVLSLATLMGGVVASATIAKLKHEHALAESARADEQAALRAEADRQRDRAQTNLEAAREAMDEFLTRVGDERLRREPRTERVQAQLLESAVASYDRFLKTEDGADPAVRRDAGWAYQRVGRVREMMGRRSDAIEAYRKAVAVFAQLTDQFPDEPRNRKGLADSHRQLAIALEADNKRAEADQSYAASRAILERLVAESPGDPAVAVELASLLNNRAMQLTARRKPLDAIRTFREALAILEPLSGGPASTRAVRFEKARTEMNLGTVLMTTNQSEPGRAMLRSAVDGFRKLAETEYDPRYAHELGRAIANLGSASVLVQKPDEALDVYQQAQSLFTQLAGKFPRVPDYRYELARTHENIAGIIQSNKGRRAAEPEHEKARTIYRDLAAAHPEIDEYRLRSALSLDAYGVFLHETGQRDAAIAAVREAVTMLQKLAADDPYDAEVQRHLGQRMLNLGMLYAVAAQDADAEATYVQAITALESALKRWPAVHSLRRSLIDAHSNQALLMKHLARPAEEEAAWVRTAEHQVKRAADFPDQPDAAAELARTQFTLAALRMDKPAQALAAVREAYDRQRSAFVLAPQRPDLLANLGLYGTALVEGLTNTGDHAAAAKAVERLVADLPPTWAGWPKIAGFLAQNLKSARSDAKLSEPDRAKAVQQYGTAALDILKRTIAAGYKDTAALQTMPELAPLRESAEFKEEFRRVVGK